MLDLLENGHDDSIHVKVMHESSHPSVDPDRNSKDKHKQEKSKAYRKGVVDHILTVMDDLKSLIPTIKNENEHMNHSGTIDHKCGLNNSQ